jgi:hypothetical protein
MPLPRRFRILPIVARAAIIAAACGAAPVGAQTPPHLEKAPPESMAPIRFYLARGEPNACGPGCNEWIAAEGKIDAGAAQRLRQLLAKLGGRRPPIYFHSPGGSVVGSLELGRLMRAQKLEVSVAHTIALCERDKPPEASCPAKGKPAEAVEAELDPTTAMCNSGCVYVVAGGAVRRVPPGVRLGIHDVGLDPDKSLPSGISMAEVRRQAHARIRTYLHEMGIDESLLTEASSIPFESMKAIGRDELVRFGIDRRDFGETNWQFTAKTVPAVDKAFFARTNEETPKYADELVMFSCGARQAIRVVLARGHDAAAGSLAGRITVNGRRIDLSNQVTSGKVDIRVASLPASSLAAIGDTATIELSDPGAGDASAVVATLKLDGFAAVYAKLQRSCDESAPGPTATAPAKPQPLAVAGAKSDPFFGETKGLPSVPGATAVAPFDRVVPRAAPDKTLDQTSAPPNCTLHLGPAPQYLTGRVVAFISATQAFASTKNIEAQVGAKISPAYMSLQHVTVSAVPGRGGWSTMAAVPASTSVKIGDVVEIESRHRDPNLPCNFVPWTIGRVIDYEQ